MKIKAVFPHKDSTGRKRKVGDVYEVSEEEALIRVNRDHFAVKVVEAPKQTPRTTAKPETPKK